MSKDYLIKDDVYLYLLKYFNGDIIYLKPDILKDLKKGVFKGNPVKPIHKKVLETFVKILKLKKQKPDLYAKLKWIYPEWDQEKKEKKLKEYFPEDYEDEENDLKLKLKEDDQVDRVNPTYAPGSPGTTPREKKDLFLVETQPDGNNVYVEEPTYSVDSPRDEGFEKRLYFLLRKTLMEIGSI